MLRIVLQHICTAVTIGFGVWTQKRLCVGHCVRVGGGASPHAPDGLTCLGDRLTLASYFLPVNKGWSELTSHLK